MEPPLVRFTDKIVHSQLLPTGHLPPAFFDPENLDWAHDPSVRTLLSVLKASYGMLSSPIHETPPGSDETLYHEWLHETQGICCYKDPDHDVESALKFAKQLRLSYPEQVRSRFKKYCAIHHKTVEVTKLYEPKRLYPQLFESKGAWPESWFVPSFWELMKGINSATKEDLTLRLHSRTNDVYVFPMFSDLFCKMLREEFQHFEASGLPSSRPNSMNNYGLIINDIGMSPLVDALLAKVIRPLAAILYPQFGGSLDHHHSFIVQYRPDGDLSLDMHTDDSEITLNVCITEDFEGGILDFCGQRGLPDHRVHSEALVHRLGYGVLHLGEQRHGAREIKTGERDNLILWFKSSSYRLSDEFQLRGGRSQHEASPDVICLSRTHDSDYNALAPKRKQQKTHGKDLS